MKPPAIKMLTPSGRFETGKRLCLSISDYHPESWNPSWSVGAVLVGLQSFMYEESDAIGSIRKTRPIDDKRRAQLAGASKAFNARNAIYRELFLEKCDEDDDDDDAKNASEPITASVCRFCFSSEGELISPCMCTDFVHLECLRKWQKSVLLTQSTHPKYQTSIDRICGVCCEPFTGIGEAPSRHEQIVAYTGRDIAAMVSEGNLLVSTRESSRDNLDLMRKHPEIRPNLKHWTKAVFLMIQARKGLIALGTSLRIDPPRHWKKYVSTVVCGEDGPGVVGSFACRHYDGGPVHPRKAVAVVHVPELDALRRQRRSASDAGTYACLDRLSYVESGILFGTFEACCALAALRRSDAASPTTTINVVWGCAAWGETQILAEIARGGWGIVERKDFEKARPDAAMDIDWALDYEWSRVVGLAKCAPKTEYTRRRRQ